jgi:hypothetical protein
MNNIFFLDKIFDVWNIFLRAYRELVVLLDSSYIA